MVNRRRGQGKDVRKTRAINAEKIDLQFKNAPHSFVIHRGKVGESVRVLSMNLRKVLEPYTASKLQVKRSNVLKDFVTAAGVLNVTHMLIFSRSEKHIQLRMARLPRGPTLTFRIADYSLSKDVLSSQKRPDLSSKVFGYHPLLVMNGFKSDDKSLQLVMTMFQNMFPSIDVQKVNLNSIRRCVLVSYDPETELIDFRHYAISVAPVGLSRSVKKLIKNRLPDLGRYQDMRDFLEKGGNLSESEGEQDAGINEVTLPQSMKGRGNIQASQSAIRLKEIGPRMVLKLVKIEEGVCGGAVIHHSFITKTPEDLVADRKRKMAKIKLKRQRQNVQKDNIRKKEKLKEENKQRSLEGMKRKQDAEQADNEDSDASEDDVSYYKKAVGSAPDSDLFPAKRKKYTNSTPIPKKKMKYDSDRNPSTGQKKRSSKTSDKRTVKKTAPPGFRKKDQVKKQKMKKDLEKIHGVKKVKATTGRSSAKGRPLLKSKTKTGVKQPGKKRR